jgi:hypothetical protein
LEGCISGGLVVFEYLFIGEIAEGTTKYGALLAKKLVWAETFILESIGGIFGAG